MAKTKEKRDISQDLATLPVGRLLLKLAIPTVAAQLVNLLYNIVDRIYIGHMPEVGSIALTGIGLCFPVIYLITAFTMLIGQGGAPRAAIEMGRGHDSEAERILGSCFTALIIIALILTAAFNIWGEELLWLFGASENTIIYAYPYMKIYASGSLFVMLSLGLNLFITTQGFTSFSMLSVVIGAVANIILDPIFIYGMDMGVEGAALATVISQGISAAFVLWFLTSKKTKLRIRKEYLMPKMKVLLPVMALGLAPFIMQSTEALINIGFNSSLQKYGGDIAVGSMTIASTILQMVWIPAQGLGQGAQPIMSFNYGARNPHRVKETFKVMLSISCAFLGGFWILVLLFPEFFIRIFNSSPELISEATWSIRVYMAVLGFFGIQMAIQQTFLSIGNAKAALFIAIMRKIVLLFPLIYILPNFFENKVFAVFLAEPVSDTLSILTAIIVFSITFPKAMKAIESHK
ncbi:MATE family efflux transporter [Alloiococcus sp. CFN-8]|uniref:MATE family efflux transporter n=1 Tax=Alloiococcus sp. CFN-8 TaxID=3416081 RepID=UPI003CF39618